MSERLSSVEIEDVLSSIRRLVSEDLRPAAKPADGAAVPEAAPLRAAIDGPGRLLLTPSLRIAPDPATGAEDEEDAGEPAPFHSRRAEGDGARVDAVMGQAARSLDPATEEDAPALAPAASVPEWFVTDEVPAAVAAEVAPAAQDPAALLAEVEAPVAVEAALSDAEIAGDAGYATDWYVQPVEALDETAAGADPVVAGAVGDAVFAPEVPEAVYVAPVAGQAAEDAMDAAPVTVDAVAPQEPEAPFWAEPDGAAARAFDPVDANEANEDWADAAEAEIRRELEEQAEATVFSKFESAPDHDEPLYDEEMLRDLVRDIIREELQGALGERITRNVRKLVRAEIARALAVRDFE